MVTTNYTYCYWGLDVRSSYVVLDKMMGKLSSRQRKHYNASSLVATTHRNVDINFPRLFINTLIKVGGVWQGYFCTLHRWKKRLWKGSDSEIATIWYSIKKFGKKNRQIYSNFIWSKPIYIEKSLILVFRNRQIVFILFTRKNIPGYRLWYIF